tara:strand:- start:492 stop:2153 length:1662 start_codon:yes stop_codon:yes gene_type:complete
MSNNDTNAILIKKSTFKDVKIIEKLIDKHAKKIPTFISGPPGTRKTSKWIVDKYRELLKKYSYENIIVLSHTNVAADEIKKEILKIPEMQDVKKKSVEFKICTIHSYCKNRLVGRKEVFSYEDHCELSKEESLFKLQTKVSQQRFDNGEQRFYKYLNDAFGKGEDDLTKFWKICNRSSYWPYTITEINKMVPYYKAYKDKKFVCDFADMIKDFLDKAKDPDIDVLIVDEAQDSNVPQRKALEKMATKTKEYYMVGDADQTIFEFAGADPEYYHRLSRNAEQLEQGYRCSQTITNLCKRTIRPIWNHYGYERVWKPTDVIGNHYHIPNYHSKCSAMEALLDKIKNTNETFLFTYRGVPTDAVVKNFFKQQGIEFAHVGNTAHVSKKEIRCHKLWPDFCKGKLTPLKQIKDFWKYIGSKVIVWGKGEETFEDWVDREYTIDYLINKKLLKESAKQERDFSLIRLQKGKKEDFKQRLIYIRKILQNGFNIDGEPRVKYANIHTVKGLSFDNVIVDLTRTRPEDYFTQLRLKYVALSRGRFDCWTVASQDKYTLGKK